MNKRFTPVKVGAIYKLKDLYANSFFQHDHSEKYILILKEDYSGLHAQIKVFVMHKKGMGPNEIKNWNLSNFERWEMICEAG